MGEVAAEAVAGLEMAAMADARFFLALRTQSADDHIRTRQMTARLDTGRGLSDK